MDQDSNVTSKVIIDTSHTHPTIHQNDGRPHFPETKTSKTTVVGCLHSLLLQYDAANGNKRGVSTPRTD